MTCFTVRMGSISGRGALFQEPIDVGACRLERRLASLRIDRQPFGEHELHVLEPEEAKKVAYVGGLRIERCPGVQPAACREHIDLLTPQQADRALGGVVEGMTGSGDMIKVSLELRGYT